MSKSEIIFKILAIDESLIEYRDNDRAADYLNGWKDALDWFFKEFDDE